MFFDKLNTEARSLLISSSSSSSSCYPQRLIMAKLLEEFKPILTSYDDIHIFNDKNHCAYFIKQLLACFTLYDNYQQILTERIMNFLREPGSHNKSLKNIMDILISSDNPSSSSSSSSSEIIENWDRDITENLIVSSNANTIFDKFKSEFGDSRVFNYLRDPQMNASNVDEIITFIKGKRERRVRKTNASPVVHTFHGSPKKERLSTKLRKIRGSPKKEELLSTKLRQNNASLGNSNKKPIEQTVTFSKRRQNQAIEDKTTKRKVDIIRKRFQPTHLVQK